MVEATSDIIKEFQLDQLALLLLEGDFSSIALQFPDSMLPSAPEVCIALEDLLGMKSDKPRLVYALSDT